MPMRERGPGLSARRLVLTVKAYDLLDGQRPARLVPTSEATRAVVARVVAEAGDNV